MFPSRRLHGLALLIAAAAVPAFAQTATTGGVSGTITQPNGSPLADAKVTLASAQVRRTTTTDGAGKFQVGLLNPGAWKITVEKAGFQTVNQTISVGTNNITPMAIRLPEVTSAVVTVLGSLTNEATIDPTTTAIGVSISNESFSKLPIGRNMNDLAYLAPTSTFGGTMSEGQGLDYSISGASGAENQFILDGLVTNDPRYGGQGTQLVTDFIDSVQVETGGFKPEYSALGGVFNAVIKSGTNDFKASAWTTYSPSSLEARAKSNKEGFRQASPSNRYDLGFDVGGPILKDRLFYYVGVDQNFSTLTPYPNNAGFQSPDQKTNTTQAIVKLNWYITPDQQLSGSYINTNRKVDASGARPNGYGDANFGAVTKTKTENLSLVYDWTISSIALLSIKAGTSRLTTDVQPGDISNLSITDDHWYSPGGGGPDPSLVGLDYFRGGYGSYANEKGTTRQVKADLSIAVGDHTLKFGVSSVTSSYFREDFASGPVGNNLSWTIYDDPSSSTGITAYSVYYGNIGGAEVKAKYQAFYVQDTWEVTPGLRAFYGARAETQEQMDPQGRSFLKFTDLGKYIQPRLGFTWDVNKDGKTKVSGSYAWYYEQIPQRIGIREFASQKYLLSFYDLATYSPTGLGVLGAPTGIVDYGGFFDSPPVANNIKLPKREEITLGFEHALAKGLVFSINGTYRKLTDVIEDSTLVDASGLGYMNLPNGPLGIVWNPGSSVTFVAKNGTTDAGGADISGQTITVNNTLFPAAYNKYTALTVGLKKADERSTWNATYTLAHLYGNYEGIIAPNYGGGGQPDGNITASWDFWPYLGTGNLGQDRRHTFKFFGSRKFTVATVDLNLGARWTWQSGLPISLIDEGSSSQGLPPGTLGAGNPLDPGFYGNSTFDHGLEGNHGRTPNVSVVDLRADSEFKLGRAKLIPSVDIFNLFNARTATSVWQYATKQSTGDPDPRYGAAQEWLQGRRYQIGVKVQF